MNEERQLSDHVIIVGWNKFARMIAEELLGADKDVVFVVDSEETEEIVHDFYGDRVLTYIFSYRDYPRFEEVMIEESLSVFLNLDSDEDKLLTILNLKNKFDDLDFIVLLENQNLKETFYSAGVTYAVSRHTIASKLATSRIYEPDVARVEEELLSSTKSEDDYDIQQYKIKSDHEYVGDTYTQLRDHLTSSMNCLPIGLSKASEFTEKEQAEERLIKCPDPKTEVNAGDYVILVTQGASEDKLESLFSVDEGLQE